MKPIITDIKVTSLSTIGAADGTIVLKGLTSGVSYGISFSKNGTPDTVTGTADDAGNLTISGLTAGHYGSLVVTQSSVADGDIAQGSDALEVTITDPAKVVNSGNEGNASNVLGAVSDNGGAIAEGPKPGDTDQGSTDVSPNKPTKKEAVLNNFLSESHEGDDAREAVIVNSESIINDLKNLRNNSGAILPATKSLLDIFVSESICHVETATTSLLERLGTEETAQ